MLISLSLICGWKTKTVWWLIPGKGFLYKFVRPPIVVNGNAVLTFVPAPSLDIAIRNNSKSHLKAIHSFTSNR